MADRGGEGATAERGKLGSIQTDSYQKERNGGSGVGISIGGNIVASGALKEKSLKKNGQFCPVSGKKHF